MTNFWLTCSTILMLRGAPDLDPDLDPAGYPLFFHGSGRIQTVWIRSTGFITM